MLGLELGVVSFVRSPVFKLRQMFTVLFPPQLITVSAATANSPLVPFISQVLPLLFEYSESPEEGIRNVVAECVGKLALMDPRTVLPQLKVC